MFNKSVRRLSIPSISRFFLVDPKGTDSCIWWVQDKKETKGVVSEARGQEVDDSIT